MLFFNTFIFNLTVLINHIQIIIQRVANSWISLNFKRSPLKFYFEPKTDIKIALLLLVYYKNLLM